MIDKGGRGAAPRLLRYSIVVWSVAIVCWLLAGILSQVLHNASALHLSTSNTSVSIDDTGALVTHIQDVSTVAPVYIAGIFFGLLAVLWAALVVLVAGGANWARILQSVLAGVGATAIVVQIRLIFLGQLSHPGRATLIPVSLNIVALAALPVAVVLLYLPSTNAYFAGRPPGTTAPVRPSLPQPVQVTRAVRLWWTSLVVSMAGVVVSLLWPDPAVQVWLRFAGLPASLAIQITLIVFLSRGANWSRILLTIFTAFGLINLIQAFTTHSSTVPCTVLSIVLLVLEVIATVLLYRPAANAYFAAARAEAVKRRFSDSPPDHSVAP
ncbi:MAG TPA: hypothetical protein VJ914_09290 [Pseudonocardiaceae bacterium]|nr:hypothetical protein [Pseudonocardiaceae bacterium]